MDTTKLPAVNREQRRAKAKATKHLRHTLKESLTEGAKRAVYCRLIEKLRAINAEGENNNDNARTND